ncbi:MAG: hypothetical protein ACLFTT_03640 [Candidatus Hydrogenedentota bacterium]
MGQRVITCLRGLYWLVTLGWLALLGVLLGRLMVLGSDTDRAPLVLLIAGTPLFALLQPLGYRHVGHLFARTVIVGAAFVVPLVESAGSRLAMVSYPVVVGYLVFCGSLAVGAHLAWIMVNRMRGMTPARTLRLTHQGGFKVYTLLVGFVLNIFAMVFLCRARAVIPVFDPIEHPNPYSRAMDLWTGGMLLVSLLAAGALVWRAWRLARVLDGDRA